MKYYQSKAKIHSGNCSNYCSVYYYKIGIFLDFLKFSNHTSRYYWQRYLYEGVVVLQQQDDGYFVEQVLAGNKQAYAFIINRYKNRLFAVVLRMVKNPEDAKDLVQECFIKVYQQLDKFDQKGSFSSWLYRVSVNHCMDTFRKKKLDAVEFIDEKKAAASRQKWFIFKRKNTSTLSSSWLFCQRKIASSFF